VVPRHPGYKPHMAYIFDPDRLTDIARNAMQQTPDDAPVDALLDRITADIDSAYPGQVDTGPRKWIYNTAGGSMGQMAVIMASMNEYILYFSTPLSTGGHSGRYKVDLWDMVLRGEMLTWRAGEMTPHVHPAGSMNVLRPGNAHGYRLTDGAVLFEYGRGPIGTALPFALADTLFSSLDFKSFAQTMGRYTELTLKGLFKR